MTSHASRRPAHPGRSSSFYMADSEKIDYNNLFAELSFVAYILNIISPGNEFKTNIKRLLKSDCRLLSLKDMGFPNNWQSLPVWV